MFVRDSRGSLTDATRAGRWMGILVVSLIASLWPLALAAGDAIMVTRAASATTIAASAADADGARASRRSRERTDANQVRVPRQGRERYR